MGKPSSNSTFKQLILQVPSRKCLYNFSEIISFFFYRVPGSLFTGEQTGIAMGTGCLFIHLEDGDSLQNVAAELELKNNMKAKNNPGKN